jgi:ribonuclease J
VAFDLKDLAKPNCLFIVPLGGLGEIGMNMMAFIYRGTAIVIDCGLQFPDSSALGIDIIIPDVRFLIESGIKIEGIVLTHGHEDHIGALPYVVEDLGFPKIYGTPFTLALAEDRLRSFDNAATGKANVFSKTQFVCVQPPANFSIGPFRLKSLQVTHSVVDSMGLIIETPVGNIVHSGDFKIDADPLDGKRIDQAALIKAGKDGVHLLISDSTNVEKDGWSKSEHEIGKGFIDLFQKIKNGKIIIGVFASNIHRIQQIIDAAKVVDRKVAFCGRSIEGNIEIALRLKYLKFNRADTIAATEIEKYDTKKVVVIATGTQAEPRSVLYRMSLNDHPLVRIFPGDTVVFSSRLIPGNEKNISHLMNNLYRRGAEVIDSETANIHASGHAYQDEQEQLIKWTQPKFFLPAHGEYRMLVKHLKLAKHTASKIEGIVSENGDILELTKDSFRKVGRAPSGKIYLDEGATDLHEDLLRDRRQLGNTGLVVVSLVVDKEEGRILEGPNFDIRGVSEVDRDALKDSILKRLLELSREARTDDVEVEEELRRVTRRFFRKENGVKPVVIPLIYEV